MSRMHYKSILTLTAALALFTGVANGAPQPLQGRTITGVAVATDDPSAVFEYDSYQNITWLRNWDYEGKAMDWSTAQGWASGLSIGGYDDWTLPDIAEYSVLWNVEGPTYADLQAHFINVRHLFYWSSTSDANALDAWAFFTDTGYETHFDKNLDQMLRAVAVRQGDVLATVPEPQTVALVLLSLAALRITTRSRPTKGLE